MKHRVHEMMACGHFLAELGRWIDTRIDLAPECLFGAAQSLHHLPERHVTNDHHVDVTACSQFVPGGRSVEQCDPNLLSKRDQCLTQDISDADRLGQQRRELREQRRSLIRLKVDLMPFPPSRDEPCCRQLLKLSLNRTHGQPGSPGDLPQVERLVRVAVQPPQDQSPGTAEENRSRIFCTHYSYDCTSSSYTIKSAA